MVNLSPGGSEVAAGFELVIIGAGRQGRSTIGVFQGAGLNVTAVLDDATQGEVLDLPVHALDAYAGPVWDAHIAVGDPAVRAALAARLQGRAYRWFTYLDRFSVVSPHAAIGAGSFVGPFNALADVRLGEHVSILSHCVLGAGVTIGAFTNVAPHATIASEAQVGQGCLIGMGARIAAGVKIGDNCRIASDCVVKRDMAAGSIAAPVADARIMRRHSRA